MKIDRLIGILSLLLQKERVTAPYLAEKFEVSRRTIGRDIEALCKAGIPIVTIQGKNGGIGIMDGYRMDKTLLTSGELQSIFTGLKGLDSVSGTNQYQQLMDKLSAGNSQALDENQHIVVDLSSYYRQSLAPKFSAISRAIDRKRRICFTYYSVKGEQQRRIEPYFLVFQWSSWYVWGYCLKQEDYRLFKLNRMLHVSEGEGFVSRNPPFYRVEVEEAFPPRFQVKAVFEPSARWRLVEEYGPKSFTEQEDGRLLFEFGFSDKESLFSWLLSFEEQAELLEPVELRQELGAIGQKIAEKYQT